MQAVAWTTEAVESVLATWDKVSRQSWSRPATPALLGDNTARQAASLSPSLSPKVRTED